MNAVYIWRAAGLWRWEASFARWSDAEVFAAARTDAGKKTRIQHYQRGVQAPEVLAA